MKILKLAILSLSLHCMCSFNLQATFEPIFNTFYSKTKIYDILPQVWVVFSQQNQKNKNLQFLIFNKNLKERHNPVQINDNNLQLENFLKSEIPVKFFPAINENKKRQELEAKCFEIKLKTQESFVCFPHELIKCNRQIVIKNSEYKLDQNNIRKEFQVSFNMECKGPINGQLSNYGKKNEIYKKNIENYVEQIKSKQSSSNLPVNYLIEKKNWIAEAHGINNKRTSKTQHIKRQNNNIKEQDKRKHLDELSKNQKENKQISKIPHAVKEKVKSKQISKNSNKTRNNKDIQIKEEQFSKTNENSFQKDNKKKQDQLKRVDISLNDQNNGQLNKNKKNLEIQNVNQLNIIGHKNKNTLGFQNLDSINLTRNIQDNKVDNIPQKDFQDQKNQKLSQSLKSNDNNEKLKFNNKCSSDDPTFFNQSYILNQVQEGTQSCQNKMDATKQNIFKTNPGFFSKSSMVQVNGFENSQMPKLYNNQNELDKSNFSFSKDYNKKSEIFDTANQSQENREKTLKTLESKIKLDSKFKRI